MSSFKLILIAIKRIIVRKLDNMDSDTCFVVGAIAVIFGCIFATAIASLGHTILSIIIGSCVVIIPVLILLAKLFIYIIRAIRTECNNIKEIKHV